MFQSYYVQNFIDSYNEGEACVLYANHHDPYSGMFENSRKGFFPPFHKYKSETKLKK